MSRSLKIKTLTISTLLVIILIVGVILLRFYTNSQRTTIDVDRNAQVIVDLSIEINAPKETVWRIQTGIDQWPTWQKNVSKARLSGPIAVGSTFQWETHGLTVVSTIREVDPMRRIVWGGPAQGIEGVHVWNITPTAKGVVVHTTESWDGPPVAADPDGMRAALTSSLNAWLADLKKTAEAQN
ncbi:SRPBCC family protein [Paenibacillus sp. HN-1]|uniref:SRPBCC family protein n=1 Tax=Paenibacillus TaxID=44249 RepID=UPI001CA8481C|nr:MULTISPECIES: SRPBCC family protein [Paenibacillus]MBY9079782.1 SRPBCC family protein [Paenibacillus sp. CGMCC 1.18879]MBY9084426.1 SRPBCC family protein [Paenibacillus sinensis]